jgi:CubicO group peptidase (beta-lactamase class C family)
MKNKSFLVKRFSKILFPFTILLFISSALFSQTDKIKDIDSYIQKGMKDWNCVGLSIAIVKGDNVIFSKGYGIREVGKSDPIDENTLFAIASNSKAFTATAIAKLAREGKLKLDDPVIKYLPWFQLYDPYVSREITVRDLLCHRTGYSTWEGDLIWYGSENNRKEVLQRLRYVKPVSSFRSQFGYSNMMFLAAGEVLHTITGLTWDEFVKNTFFTPLDMKRSNTSVDDFKNTDNIAMPHADINGKITAIPYRNLDNVGPAASINSSVKDLAQWIKMQLNKGIYNSKQVIDSNVIFETRNPNSLMRAGRSRLTHFSAYGLGWFLKDYNGRIIVYHDGGMDGMLSKVCLIPEENIGFVILTNYDGQTFYSALTNYITDLFLDVPKKDWSSIYLEYKNRSDKSKIEEEKKMEDGLVKGTLPSLKLLEYTGNYNNEMLGDATISEKDGAICLQIKKNRGLSGKLRHSYYDTFICTWDDAFLYKSLVTFTIGVNGKAEEFRVKVREDFVDPVEYVFKK